MFINSISASKSDIIDQCLWKYKLKYIERLSPLDRNNDDALNFGSYIHRIFELGFNSKGIKELLAISDEIKSNYKIPLKYKDNTLKCLENFIRFNSTLKETVSTEKVFELPLDEKNDINFRGVIDRIILGDDGYYLVLDYKTSKREKKKKDLLDDKQLMGYAYAIHTMFNVPFEKIVCGHYYPLTDNLVTVKFTKYQVSVWKKKEIDRVWRIRKKKKDDFPAMRNVFCDWCDYKSACPSFNPMTLVCSRIEEQKKLDEERRLKESELLKNPSDDSDQDDSSTKEPN